jgi:uncharacterized protein YkwD
MDKPSRRSDDIMPLMLFLWVVIAVFFLIRPPVLLFWNYGLGMAESIRPEQTVQQDSPLLAKPMQPVPTPAVLAQPWPAPPARSPALRQLEQDIFNLTVDERTQRQKTSLGSDNALADVAAQHSRNMYDSNFFSHTSPDGEGPADRFGKGVRQAFGLVAENIAGESVSTKAQEPVSPKAQAFIEGWMNSPGHRRNILAEGQTHLGVGCAGQTQSTEPSKTICTQLFLTAFAWLEQPLPERAKADQTIPLSLRAEPGQPLPIRVYQVDLGSGSTKTSVDLNLRNGRAVGDLTVKGPPGIYRTEIGVPDPENANRFLLIPGPYIVIE